MNKPLTLVTGATGFVGNAVVKGLIQAENPVVAVVRHLPAESASEAGNFPLIWCEIGSINKHTNWQIALEGVQTVVHCAAIAHKVRDSADGMLASYREVNVYGTLHLAKQAAAAGVKRFVFLSSVGVYGKESSTPYSEDDIPSPYDAYTLSKLEAENSLLEFARQSSIEVVIIRSPLVYGPNAPGNFASLVRWVCSGIPLPLGAVRNQRSLVALNNIVSLVLICADCERSPQAANQIFLVADEQDVSTTTLLIKVAKAAGCPIRLLAVPPILLSVAATLLGKGVEANRLLGNLQVDTTKARNMLGWRPVISLEQQLSIIFNNPNSPISTNTLNICVATQAILRLFDVLLAGLALLTLWPIMLVLYVLSLIDTGSPLLYQERVGRYQKSFILVKFRTMRNGTAFVPSHLVSSEAITPLGALLRYSKLDELPQLWNVLKGEMSLVGPRPCLLNQTELIQERAALNVFAARPGITGLAQVQNIDMSIPRLLAETDAKMLQTLTISAYFKYIFTTVVGRGSGDGVKRR